MEYPSQYDFFLRFKSIFDEDGHFIDYILVNTSDNFQYITNIKSERILGKKISEIATEYEQDVFGINDIYYYMVPKTRRKFEKHIEKLNRWYLINIFSDCRDYLILFYNDISRIKKTNKTTYEHRGQSCIRNF